MSIYTPIDLSTLPAPSVVEPLDYEAILSAMLTDLQARDPAFTALVESDPAYKILEVAAYRELLVRQRVNDAAREVMLAYSTGANLEQLAALFGVTRKTVTPADNEAIPPVPAVMETDTDLRYRTQLALEGFSTAGPAGAYQFHALSVDGIKDVAVAGPPVTSPGYVRVTVLGNDGNGEVDAPLLADVALALNDDDVRPLTDNVTVQSATVVEYTIRANIYILPGPDSAVVTANAQAAAEALASASHKVGRDIRVSALYAALHQAGVERVELLSPGITADLICDDTEAPYCTGITLFSLTA